MENILIIPRLGVSTGSGNISTQSDPNQTDFFFIFPVVQVQPVQIRVGLVRATDFNVQTRQPETNTRLYIF